MPNRKRLTHGILSACMLLLALLAGACTDYEAFTSDPSARLEFSCDTLAFDTIISTVPSATRSLTVFNRNKKGVRIASVSLAAGSSSHFRVNVDGEWLADGAGEDFKIYRKDTMIVRVEVTVPQVESTQVGTINDVLRFVMESGNVHEVVLQASAIDAYMVHGMVIDHDSTLLTDKPYLIYDSLYVGPGAQLSLLPGTRLMFHDDAAMHIHGSVHAEGTLEQPIIFRGDRLDHMFGYLPYDNMPNRWQGINIHTGSTDNRSIHYVGGDGLRLDNCKARVGNSQISNTKGDCVYIFGGDYEFVHCTIAQFYPFTANRGSALYMANNIGEANRDIRQASFINCVITGYADDVIKGSIVEGQDYTCPYLFSHCLLNTIKSDDSVRFVHITYDSDKQELHREKNFVLFDTDNFLYDFTPDSLSLIRSLADSTAALRYPTDLRGRSRFADGAPDAGCLEYVKE